MARILRGDIIWADLNPVKKKEQAGKLKLFNSKILQLLINIENQRCNN